MAISTGGAHGGGSLGLGAGQTVFATGGGGGRVAEASRGGAALRLASSFGVDQTSLDNFAARSFLQSERVRTLAARESYYRCTTHDWKQFDFDGRMIQPGPPTSQPMIATEAASWYVPLKLRRPSAPYRIPRIIVNSFTSLLFGHGRWPTFRIHGDPATEDFVGALVKAVKLRTLMVRARNIGGSVGTVGLSWRYHEGRPSVHVHNGKHLYVHAWEDREQLVPEHVSECYTFPRDEFDPQKKRYVRNLYWYRRDWTPTSDVVFKEALFENDRDPQWEVDEERTVEHGDGYCHFVWIQNVPEDDSSSIDGQPDYAELYESFDSLDLLKSVIVRGATLNLDPTLILKLDPDIVQRMGVKKGSDNSLVVGKDGDANYMELGGQSISVGIDLFKQMRNAALEAAQCVVPDPNTLGTSAHSSPALKVIYEPMLSKSEVLRVQYGDAMVRLLTQMTDAARKRSGDVEIVIDPDSGEESETRAWIDLPPRYELVTTKDEDTGKETETLERHDRLPGQGGEIELDWPDYFNPTEDDKQKAVTTITAAVMGKVMPQESGVEEIAALFKRNSRTELKRVLDEAKKVFEQTGSMFAEGTVGGAVDEQGELPLGAEPLPTDAAAAESNVVDVDMEKESKLQLTGTDLASITTVNEGRGSVGLPILRRADGTPDPDGNLTIREFNAKREAQGEKLGEATGTASAEAKFGPAAGDTQAKTEHRVVVAGDDEPPPDTGTPSA